MDERFMARILHPPAPRHCLDCARILARLRRRLREAVEVAGVKAEGRDDGGADVGDGGELGRVVRVGGEVEAAALVLRPDNRSG